MKHVKLSVQYFLIAILSLIITGCVEYHMTLIIQPDGSCTFVSDITAPRSTLEQQIRWVESYSDEEAGKTETALTDDELKKQLQGLLESQYARYDYKEQEFVIEQIEVQEETVQMKIRLTYLTIKDFIMRSDFLRDSSYDHLRIDETDDGKLSFTLSHDDQNQPDNVDAELDQMAAFGFKGSLKVVMPGEIISSSLPETEGNATWVNLDTTDKEKARAVLSEMLTKPLIIIAEKGGLNAELPLDSKELFAQEREKQRIGHWLPVTEAEPGYLAEATSVTTTQIIYFPEGKKQLEEHENTDYSDEQEGAVIRARLYTPEGRRFLTIEKIENINAIDDQEREVPILNKNQMPTSIPFSPDLSAEMDEQVDFTIHLTLPESDAEAIEELTGEAVVVTCGTWKESRLDRIQEDPEKEYDLATVLPGTTMVIKKIEQTDDKQGSLHLQLKGSDHIRYLEFTIETPGVERVSIHKSSDNVTEKDDQIIRNVSMEYYYYDEQPTVGELSLIVRFPDDLKRELVLFTLEAIDLY